MNALPAVHALPAVNALRAVTVRAAVMVALILRPVRSLAARSAVRRVQRSQHGQTTAEYALVIVGAAAVAGLLIAWAAQSHAISKLFDVVIGHLTQQK